MPTPNKKVTWLSSADHRIDVTYLRESSLMSPHDCSRRPIRRLVRSLFSRSNRYSSPREGGHRHVAIEVLPDDALLKIFAWFGVDRVFYLDFSWWITLSHVCRGWRNITFASPGHLNVYIPCNIRTLKKAMLVKWPPFPLALDYATWCQVDPESPEVMAVAALEHRDRISAIAFDLMSDYDWGRLISEMQEPFPALTHLHLTAGYSWTLPEAFLGGYAPRLRSFTLESITFPTLPKLLSSTRHLVSLHLIRIPVKQYISPEVMATCLATLPSLRDFSIKFDHSLKLEAAITSFLSTLPIRGDTPWITRTQVPLPSLADFEYSGISAYLEDLVARIDAPLLDSLRIKYFDIHVFRSPQLHQFIARTEKLRPLNRACMTLHHWSVKITFDSPIHLDLGNVYEPFFVRVSAMSRLCDQTSLLLSHVKLLEIRGNPSHAETSQLHIPSANWIEIFNQFTSVESLFVSSQLMPFVAPALQGLKGERATDVLPALRSLSFELPEQSQSGLLQGAIKSFVTVRQLSGFPVTVERWGQLEEPC